VQVLLNGIDGHTGGYMTCVVITDTVANERKPGTGIAVNGIFV
jgi:hypothetical protein